MYKIGHLNIRMINPELIPSPFLFPPTDTAAETDLEIEIIHRTHFDKKELFYGVEHETYWLERPSHRMEYHTSNKLTIYCKPKLTKLTAYWFQRDLFGILATLSHDGVIHSSAVEFKDHAYLFCAVSGTGKSTIANNLRAFSPTISDEINWIYYDKNGELTLVNQLYYRGESQLPTLPIKQMYALKQSPNCFVTNDVTSAEKLHLLLATYIPFTPTDPFMHKRLPLIQKIVQNASVKRLHLNLNRDEIAQTIWKN